jgi:TolB-like protein
VLTIVASNATTTAEAATPDIASISSRLEAGVLSGGVEVEGGVIRVNTYNTKNSTTALTAALKISAK